MKEVFDRIIAKLEDIAERDDYGWIVNLYDATDVVREVEYEYDGKYLSKKEYEELLEYKYMYENLCK